MRRTIDGLQSRPAVLAAQLAQLAFSVLLLVTASSLSPSERDILGVPQLDARWLFLVGGLWGIVYAFAYAHPRVLTGWLVLLGLTTLGRALDLIFSGTEYLNRTQELRGFLGWLALFLALVVVALFLTAAAQLRQFRQLAEEEHYAPD